MPNYLSPYQHHHHQLSITDCCCLCVCWLLVHSNSGRSKLSFNWQLQLQFHHHWYSISLTMCLSCHSTWRICLVQIWNCRKLYGSNHFNEHRPQFVLFSSWQFDWANRIVRNGFPPLRMSFFMYVVCMRNEHIKPFTIHFMQLMEHGNRWNWIISDIHAIRVAYHLCATIAICTVHTRRSWILFYFFEPLYILIGADTYLYEGVYVRMFYFLVHFIVRFFHAIKPVQCQWRLLSTSDVN